MGLYHKLQDRAARSDPLRVGLIGAGKFGSMFLAQIPRLPGIHVVGIADIAPDAARDNLANIGWDADQYAAASLNAAMQSGATHVGPDAMALIHHPGIDIIIECTGNPIIAVDHLMATFGAGKHAISATVEADALCGAALARAAADATPATAT